MTWEEFFDHPFIQGLESDSNPSDSNKQSSSDEEWVRKGISDDEYWKKGFESEEEVKINSVLNADAKQRF